MILVALIGAAAAFALSLGFLVYQYVAASNQFFLLIMAAR